MANVTVGAAVGVDELFTAWKSWCEEQGDQKPGTKTTFGVELRSAVPGLRKRRHRDGERRLPYYAGIGLGPPDLWADTRNTP
jgi:putative DNA primase/helicase